MFDVNLPCLKKILLLQSVAAGTFKASANGLSHLVPNAWYKMRKTNVGAKKVNFKFL